MKSNTPKPPKSQKYKKIIFLNRKNHKKSNNINNRSIIKRNNNDELNNDSSDDLINSTEKETKQFMPSLYTIKNIVSQNPPSGIEGIATSPKYNHTVKSMQANRLNELQRRVSILRNNYDKINKQCEDMDKEIENLEKQYAHMQETRIIIYIIYRKRSSK